MQHKFVKPELLMPAGDLEKLRFAFAYGADAVYAGAPQFSLRARENGFTEELLAKGIDYAHGLKKKFYLTLNIVAHNRKIKPFINKIASMIEAGPDALIMADPGLIDLVKEKYPDMDIHLSVQANAMNWATVKFWQKMGVTRIILSRELSIDEIKEIKDRVPDMEIEAFVHGAICIAHSGRCLLSNYFNYRDANDGCCTNACRWSYKVYAENVPNKNTVVDSYEPLKGNYYLEEMDRHGELMRIDEDEHGTYIMNAKELMAIEYLDKLMAAGVDSFKAEGRTKSIYYLTMVARTYRMAIDDLMQGKPFHPQYILDLKKLHHRGYTAGFLINRADQTLQRYEEGLSNIFSQEFGGVVLAKEKDKLLITPRNKVSVGDKIEIISPIKSVYTTIESLTLEDGSNVASIHGGTNVKAWIPFDEDLDTEFAILSRVVTDKEEIKHEKAIQ